VIAPEDLGARAFREAHRVRYAYVAGSMYKGIASKEMVIRMARAGLLSYLGTGGMRLERVADDLRAIQAALPPTASFGANLLCNLAQPEVEDRTIDLFLTLGIERIEAAAFMQMTPALVRYRVTGLDARPDGSIAIPHKVLAKVSRPEVAEAFMGPPPARVVAQLLETGRISADEARLAASVPMCDDLCAEADSAGHTDNAVAYALVPAMVLLRDRLMAHHGFTTPVRVGTGGGLGTPQAIAAAFVLGAEFVLTGSVNQCTVEGGISATAKDLLQAANVQDTTMVPAGDMFEIGARAQVLKRGLFFPARANKLYELYRRHGAWEEIDQATRTQIETKYFKKSVAEVWEETHAYYARTAPAELDKAARDPKHRLALLCRWYFVHTARLALNGSEDQKVDYQIHCGPALGAFNQWVKDTPLADWRQRHVDDIAERLMTGAAQWLEHRTAEWIRPVAAQP